MNTFCVLVSLSPDQAGRFVGSDLDPNCLQTLSAKTQFVYQSNWFGS